MGRKEENIKKAQTLLHQKERIRNIGTAAHIDHGKCEGPETRVWVNGQWIRAEDLWNRFADRPAVSNSHEADIRDVQGDSLWTRSFDIQTGSTNFAQITHAWRVRATEPLVAIETRDGRRIRTTPEHRYVVASEQGLVFREARAVSKGDFLAVPRRLPSREDDRDWMDLEQAVLQRLASDPRFLFSVSESDIRSYESRGPLRGKDLPKDENGRVSSEIYEKIDAISVRRPGVKGRASQEIRLPRRDELEDFFWLVGLLYGDGDGLARIHMGDDEMIGRACEIENRLTSRANISRYPKRVAHLNPGSTAFKGLLQVVFGYPDRRKAWSIRLPNLLYTAPLPLAAAFVQGYFDADGTVEKARSAVSATSVSEEFLDGLQLLLLRFGIRAILLRRTAKNTLYVSGKKNLARMPLFSDPEKAAWQQKLEMKASTSYVVDLIPVDWRRLAPNDWKSRFYMTAGQRPSAHSLLSMADVDLSTVEAMLSDDLAFVEVKDINRSTAEWVYDFSVPGPRNFVAVGLLAHNNTLSACIIPGAGMISEELAGTQLFMDYDEQEQARGITINAAIASMVHDHEGKQYLINLIDTPGHVDFGGDVTRAMRAIDGVIILDDAVEGVMPQTETVIRQALKERVKPVLFINKVDRLVNELKITPEQMQQRFQKIITEVNARIRKWLPPELGEKWMVNVEAGSVAFGSAYHKWAVSAPFTKRTGIGFKDIYKHCQEGTMKELAKKAPLHNVVLNMVIRHLPNPLEAQKIRIPIIWKGDPQSPVGKAMMTVDENGPIGYMVTKIIVDPQAGEVAAGRLYSGKIRRGQELWVSGMPKPQRAPTVAMIVGTARVPVDEIDAGNVVAVVGLKDAVAGSTVSDDKAPNKHNRFYMEVEPLEAKIVQAIRAGEIASGQRIKDSKALAKKLEELGMDRNEAKNVVWIQDTNMLIDATKGIQYLHETMELIKEAYMEAMGKGPLAGEKSMAVKVRLVDAKLHEDSVHRGPAQVIPAARSSIYGAMVQGGRILLEPIQKVFINVPQDYMGSAIGDIQSRRGVIEDINQEGEITIIHAKAPVAEMFGFASAIRSATQGRALWSTENSGFEAVPGNLQSEVVRAIRTRKGLPPEPYDEAYYAA